MIRTVIRTDSGPGVKASTSGSLFLSGREKAHTGFWAHLSHVLLLIAHKTESLKRPFCGCGEGVHTPLFLWDRLLHGCRCHLPGAGKDTSAANRECELWGNLCEVWKCTPGGPSHLPETGPLVPAAWPRHDGNSNAPAFGSGCSKTIAAYSGSPSYPWGPTAEIGSA